MQNSLKTMTTATVVMRSSSSSSDGLFCSQFLIHEMWHEISARVKVHWTNCVYRVSTAVVQNDVLMNGGDGFYVDEAVDVAMMG